ncbi:MAG: type II toxin-antitoxin system VapC family toxin [Burkholderiales bacterium]
MKVLLDTHVWVWWLTANSPLSVRERVALDNCAERRDLYLSAISLWETQVFHAKGRLELPVSFEDWIRQAANERMISLVPITVDVILALNALPKSFHGDSADRVIVASARAYGHSLATHDATIRRSRAVSIWKS